MIRRPPISPLFPYPPLFRCLLPASEFAIALVQRLAAHVAAPWRLPRLDFQAGVPEDARTMDVDPTLLTSVAGVAELLEHVRSEEHTSGLQSQSNLVCRLLLE